MIKRKLQVWLPLLFSLAMIAGMYMGYKMRDSMPGKSFFYLEKRRPLQEIMDLIQNKYVDDVDTRALSDTAIDAILAKLDPHSTFIPAEELQQVNEELDGSFYGIGVEFSVFDDTLHIINVLKDGPAYQAGLKTGDKILKAGDSIVSGIKISTDRIRKILRGPKGTVTSLLVFRNNKKITREVVRGEIPIYSIDAAYMMDSITGFIRLNRFSRQTYREFMTSLESLKKEGLRQLIFDLRSNGGGVLEEAIEIADEFLSGDKLISYTEGKHVAKREYRCRRLGQFETGKLIVLADEGTASASEILIGALQDWERATIIGKRTFGKGLVQDQYDLSDKSALRLTIARYYTPLGRSIQRSYANGGKAYYEEISKRYAPGFSQDSIFTDTTVVYRTKSGKRLFGGGGIIPDYFVSADTSRLTITLAKILSRGLINDFGYKYIVANPALPETYKRPRDFVRSFNFSDESWKTFENLAMKDSISLSMISPKEKTYILNALKSSIARQLYRSEGFFESINSGDSSVRKALQILGK